MSHDLRFSDALENRPEAKSFLKTALAWQGSVTPRVLPRVAVVAVYSLAVAVIANYYSMLSLPITPFEYSGAMLGLLLVLRVNSGTDRWWEARKIWGSIVNQSRNLALAGYVYAKESNELSRSFLHWVALWPSVMRQSLRGEIQVQEASRLIGDKEAQLVFKSQHMPTYVGFKIAHLLKQLRSDGLDSFAFQSAEANRNQLIDAIGACERIRNTRMPLVLAIKTRRFILLFLTLLPFALAERLGLLTPLVVALAAYPLFSLDEIGAELQNPFSPRNLSHLPLDQICKNIEQNVLAIESYDHQNFDFRIAENTLPLKESYVFIPSVGATKAESF